MGDIDIKENDKTLSLLNQNLTQITINKQSYNRSLQITNFNASKNSIKQMIGISIFHNLRVLNLSHNQIQKIEGLTNLKQLCALILNNNQIKLIQGLEKCLELNTLVLSNNQIINVQGISHLNKLEKLQLSHNQIEDLENCICMNLEQLNVNNNKIQEIPKFFSQLTKLKRLDIGKNDIKDPQQMIVLKDLKLIHLNIAGNPCSDKAIQIAIKFPRIRFINNLAAEKVLEQHQSKVPQKIREKTEKVQKKISQPMVSYDLEQEQEAVIIKKPKRSQIVKVEKNKQIDKKQKQRIKNINLDQETKIEKW
ncbi:unnamed protein product [Paramecium primaurelia]|uniref:Leucine rich repeat protein n=1 Tax=Paramecium primaurelia TaxID=5886 RepID=A0A8S1K5K9_PARPR|nr:unnamed protein product [Paramecium primaurelia]